MFSRHVRDNDAIRSKAANKVFSRIPVALQGRERFSYNEENDAILSCNRHLKAKLY